jgi:uncharacterized protein
MTIWIIFGAFMLISLLVGNQLKRRFRKYSKIPVNGYLSGKEVAEKMLRENGIFDVQVVSVPGELTDHYNPANKTINLSKDVYHGQNISAASVAAHETGHAIQHAQAYAWLNLRTTLVPLQNISAKVINVIFIGMLFGSMFLGALNFQFAGTIIIASYAVFTLFAFVTLPVEFDASRRALAWLSSAGITNHETFPKAKDGLKWAAMTYVVAALASLATLLYYIAAFAGNND